MVTGTSHVHHGFGLLEKLDPAFSNDFENSSIKTLGYTEKKSFSMRFLGNPRFVMETLSLEHGSSETRGLQANPTNSKGFVVQGTHRTFVGPTHQTYPRRAVHNAHVFDPDTGPMELEKLNGRAEDW